MAVRLVKTRISLGIRPVWSVFAVRMKKAWVLSYPLSVQLRLIRLGGCPGWSESSLGAQSFCWFCHVAAQIVDLPVCITWWGWKYFEIMYVFSNYFTYHSFLSHSFFLLYIVYPVCMFYVPSKKAFNTAELLSSKSTQPTMSKVCSCQVFFIKNIITSDMVIIFDGGKFYIPRKQISSFIDQVNNEEIKKLCNIVMLLLWYLQLSLDCVVVFGLVWFKMLLSCIYCNFPKYSDTPKIYHSKIWTMWLYHRVMCPNDADRTANSVDPDQTAPLGLIWVYTVCPDLSIRKLRKITVIVFFSSVFYGSR